MMNYAIVGPTACGKTGRAVALARALGGEVVSADSRQVYRGMDIGTGKDLDEYGDVPYHLIDICPAGYKYNLYEYVRDYGAVRADLQTRGVPEVLCGGTGMYVETVLNGIALPPVPRNDALHARLEGKSLDELTALLRQYKTLRNNSDIDTVPRALRALEIAVHYHDHPDEHALTRPHPRRDMVVVGIDIDRETRRARITRRLRDRLDAGMVDEVRRLLDSGIAPDDLMYYGLEYKFVTLHAIGRLTFDEMFRQLETAIHQFAKRQMTWWRGMERRGHTIHWLPYDMPEEEFVEAVLAVSSPSPESSPRPS